MRGVAAMSAGAMLFAGTAELAVRLLDPQPRVQIVRGGMLPWHMVGGVPQWTVSPVLAPVLEGRDCAHDASARQVALVGDSVLQVSQINGQGPAPGADVRAFLAAHLAVRLGDALNAAGNGRWCVRDLAQSGYMPYQFPVALKTAAEDASIDLAVIEVFKPEARYSVLGPDLYNIHGWPVTAVGTPRGGVPLPDLLQDALFARSAAWAYVTLATGGPDPTSAAFEIPDDASYRVAMDWALAHGIDVVLLQVPTLNVPFEQSAVEGGGAWSALEAAAEARGVGVVRLAEALRGEDVTRLRMDMCCHYSPEGHAAVARVLRDALLARVDREQNEAPALPGTTPHERVSK